jgi:hypothetical protein
VVTDIYVIQRKTKIRWESEDLRIMTINIWANSSRMGLNGRK